MGFVKNFHHDSSGSHVHRLPPLLVSKSPGNIDVGNVFWDPLLRFHLGSPKAKSPPLVKNGWEFRSLWSVQGVPFCTQACCPATVRTERFALLCFQPQAVPASSGARTCPLPRTHPCGVCTWSGHTIDMLRGLCTPELQSTNLAPAWVTEGRGPFQLTTSLIHVEGEGIRWCTLI